MASSNFLAISDLSRTMLILLHLADLRGIVQSTAYLYVKWFKNRGMILFYYLFYYVDFEAAMDNLISISFSFIFKEIKVSLTLTARGSTLLKSISAL